jgi:hypothetical protein
MTQYKRKWKCGICGEDVVYDDKNKTVTCGCGVYPCTIVNLNAFEPLEAKNP